MPKYEVEIVRSETFYIMGIEASNPEEAKEKAEEMVMNNRDKHHTDSGASVEAREMD